MESVKVYLEYSVSYNIIKNYLDFKICVWLNMSVFKQTNEKLRYMEILYILMHEFSVQNIFNVLIKFPLFSIDQEFVAFVLGFSGTSWIYENLLRKPLLLVSLFSTNLHSINQQDNKDIHFEFKSSSALRHYQLVIWRDEIVNL